MSTSFRKRNAKQQMPFTRTSPQTGQTITSSGNPSFDVLLGGGLPLGSLCLIEEDKFATYSKVLAKYFMAEGVCSKQSVFLGSLDDCPKEMIEKLPKPVTAQESETDKDENEIEKQSEQNGLRIAWGYNDLPMVNSELSNAPIGHNFNLMEHIDKKMLRFADTVTWCDGATDNDIIVNQDDDDDDEGEEKAKIADYSNENDVTFVMDSSKDIGLEQTDNVGLDIRKPSDEEQEAKAEEQPTIQKVTTEAREKIFQNPQYYRLLVQITQLLRDDTFHPGGLLGRESLCRVCLTSLASPLWYDDKYGEDLLKFMTILRASIRSSTAVCFITMPMHLVAKYDEALVPKLRNLVDYAIELESFAVSDKETNPAFKEYHGLIHLRKITAINTLSAYMPETTDLAFKLRRKKFVIEKLHLPPELQEDNETAMDTQPTLSCGSNISSNPKISMDF